MKQSITKLFILFILTASTLTSGIAIAADSIGFRWGDSTDDSKLIHLSQPIANHQYRLTREVILDTILFLEKMGWSGRSSGGGIYYSSDLTDSFGDGRKELFIFEISSSVNIATGGLGTSVRDYYLHQGPEIPMISRYNQTWHVIARAPTIEQFNAGQKIVFHVATQNDGAHIYDLIQSGSIESEGTLTRDLDQITNRLNSQEYGKGLPIDTREFFRAFAKRAIQRSSHLKKNAEAVIEALDRLGNTTTYKRE